MLHVGYASLTSFTTRIVLSVSKQFMPQGGDNGEVGGATPAWLALLGESDQITQRKYYLVPVSQHTTANLSLSLSLFITGMVVSLSPTQLAPLGV